jgi:hypothetical protein
VIDIDDLPPEKQGVLPYFSSMPAPARSRQRRSAGFHRIYAFPIVIRSTAGLLPLERNREEMRPHPSGVLAQARPGRRGNVARDGEEDCLQGIRHVG